MLFKHKTRLLTVFILMATLLFAAACSASGAQEPTTDETPNEAEHDDNHEHEEGDHAHEDADHDESEPHGRIPTENGAVIRITSPTNGAVFQQGDQIVVEVETENFDLLQEGNHWHVYVDGSSWGMIMGGSANHVLNGVEPGEYEISVYMSIATHEEYEDGDSVLIMVEE